MLFIIISSYQYVYIIYINISYHIKRRMHQDWVCSAAEHSGPSAPVLDDSGLVLQGHNAWGRGSSHLHFFEGMIKGKLEMLDEKVETFTFASLFWHRKKNDNFLFWQPLASQLQLNSKSPRLGPTIIWWKLYNHKNHKKKNDTIAVAKPGVHLLSFRLKLNPSFPFKPNDRLRFPTDHPWKWSAWKCSWCYVDDPKQPRPPASQALGCNWQPSADTTRCSNPTYGTTSFRATKLN